MATLSQVREALATTLRNYCSIDLNVYAYVEDIGGLPAVLIEPATANFEAAMHAADDEWDLNLFVLVSRSDPASGQSTLDKLVGGDDTESIRRIVFAHHELGLEGVDAEVYSMKGYGGKFDWYGAAHVGAILKVRVRTSK